MMLLQRGRTLWLVLLLTAPLALAAGPVAAASGEHGHDEGKDMHAAGEEAEPIPEDLHVLVEEVERLRSRVAALEKQQPSFTEFMPNFSERFHVMHLAGDVGDWAVANHEVLELQRLLGVAKVIDPQKGQLMESFVGENLRQLNGAIEHGDRERFFTLLDQTIVQCNACHKAVGSGFIEVSLAVDEILTMRHSHKLHPSDVGEHEHAH